LVAAGGGAGAGGGGGATTAFGVGAGAGAGAATGAGAGAAFGATMAPSQPAAAVAGVQATSRQHKPVEFFQTSPDTPRQLSTVWAPATVESAAAAISIATLFSFFMVLLEEKAAAARRIIMQRSKCPSPKTFSLLCHSRIQTGTPKIPLDRQIEKQSPNCKQNCLHRCTGATGATPKP